jgi:hypothetical protein
MLFVISGIPASEGGTGQLVAYLHDWTMLKEARSVILITKPSSIGRSYFWGLVESFRWFHAFWVICNYSLKVFIFSCSILYVRARASEPLLMLHPQNLGYKLAWKLLNTRKSPATLFMLDNSFFCVASYNHLFGTNSPCLLCCSKDSSVGKRKGCKPFPRVDEFGFYFTDYLRMAVPDGSVRLLAQNVNQARLAKSHFALEELPPVVGLWSKDWCGIDTDPESGPTLPSGGVFEWDVVFHGHLLNSKGVGWLLEVAKHCPELNFFFPIAPLQSPQYMLPNCYFNPCSWETGLKEAVMNARYVAVPSLWSAPIEGSLIKSIAYARGVIVAFNETAFCSELPEGLVFTASMEPKIAATQLRDLCSSNWVAPIAAKARWLNDFCLENKDFAQRLFDASRNK